MNTYLQCFLYKEFLPHMKSYISKTLMDCGLPWQLFVLFNNYKYNIWNLLFLFVHRIPRLPDIHCEVSGLCMSIVNAERQINGPVLWISVLVVGVITLLLIVFLFFFLLWCKRSRNNIAPIPSDLRKIVWLHNHNSSQTLPISASGATSASHTYSIFCFLHKVLNMFPSSN
jgi:hypothetical protein